MPAKPDPVRRDDFLAAVLTALWLLAWRAALGVSWGFGAPPAADGSLDAGIIYNAGDTWSYLSWVRQYQNGAGLASLLYTTEPHAALLWIFPLWTVGRFAALTGLPTIGVYNAAGLVGAVAAVWGFRRAAAYLGLGSSARNWATVALLVGSGGSWTWHFAHKLGIAPPAATPELFFFDLFPATSLLVYPYHALGLGLLAGLWWSVVRLEAHLLGRQPAAAAALCVIAFAGLLAASRPYEPLAFLGAWTLKTAWHALCHRREPAVWRAAWQIQLLLAAACTPGIAWSVWVSTRPVWSTFARESLSLGNWFGPLSWALALAGWIVLAIAGAGAARRTAGPQVILPIAATVLLVLVLVGLGSGRAKLASGLLLGPALLAGWGAEHLTRFAPKVHAWLRVPVAAVLLFALLGVPSFLLAVQTIRLQPAIVLDPALPALAARLPISPGHPPLVLAGPEPAAALPGLIGARVWAGHFSLTHRYAEKLARLRAAGLDPAVPPANPASAAQALAGILQEAPFDFALLEPAAHRPRQQLLARGWTAVDRREGWVLLAAPPSPLRP